MIRVVIAAEEDLPRILEIEQDAISPPWTHGALLSAMYKDDSIFFVAIDGLSADGDVVGFAVFRQVGDDGELLKIAVDKSARGKGFGDLLMNAVLEKAKDNAFPSIFLEVRSSNTAAIRLYEKHGFSTVRVRKNYYNYPVEDAIVMIINL